MITKAIVKDGGLFIPDIDVKKNQLIKRKNEVNVKLEILDIQDDDGIFGEAAGLLKKRNIDPIKFQEDLRSEW